MLHSLSFYLRYGAALAAGLAAPFATLAQSVGIGTTQPTQTLDVNGSLRVRGVTGAGTRLLQADATGTVSPAATALPAGAAVVPALAATATGLNNPLVAASGPLAVVLNRGASPLSLSCYDVSAPASPVLRGTYTGPGLGSVNTSSAAGTPLALSGTTAAVYQNTSPYQVSVFTLGSGAPVLASTLTLPAATSGYYAGVAMAGNLLFVAADHSGGGQGYFYVYDVSNPAAPVLRNGTASTTGFFTPTAIAAAGTLVCVSAPYGATAAADHFNVLDVSNPAAPAVVGTSGGTSTASYTGSARPLAMSPGLVVALQPENNLLTAYDLGTPSAPALRCTYATAANPVSVALSGSLAYVACAGTSQLQVVDVSTSPATLRGTVALDATASSVAATSALVLAANKSAANDLQVFTLPTREVVVYPDGTAMSAASPGAADFIQNQTAAAQAGGFRVSGAGAVGGSLAVGSTVTVGPAAAPGQVLTPATGAHNMLAVAYGQLNGVNTTTGQVVSSSDNFTISNVSTSGSGVFFFNIKFTAASGLASTDLSTYPVMATRADGPGFVAAFGNPNGQVGFVMYNVSGMPAPGKLNFVLYQP